MTAGADGGEAEMIDRLLGQADWLYMEWSLLKQKYLLATEELDLLRARAEWLDHLVRVIAGDPAVDPEGLVVAVATSGGESFDVGEMTVLDPETLREPFGACREADRDSVELFGQDVHSAAARSCVLRADGRPSDAPGGGVSDAGASPPTNPRRRAWFRWRRGPGC